MKLSKDAYEILKRLALVWIPAVATLYGALSAIIGLPATAAVLGVLTAIDAFLGVMLGVSTSMYNAGVGAEGTITVTRLPGQDMPNYAINFIQELEVVEQKALAVFKVVHVTASTLAPAVPVSTTAPATGGGTSAPGHPVV